MWIKVITLQLKKLNNSFKVYLYGRTNIIGKTMTYIILLFKDKVKLILRKKDFEINYEKTI